MFQTLHEISKNLIFVFVWKKKNKNLVHFFSYIHFIIGNESNVLSLL